MVNYNVIDLTVHEALERVAEYIENSVTVVRNVDGARSLEDLSETFNFHQIDYQIINSNLCLSKENLLQSIEENVFTGFDEVWIFKDSAPKRSLTDVPYSTGDALFYKNELDKSVYERFQEENCVLLLADGVQLHYLTTDQVLFSMINKNG